MRMSWNRYSVLWLLFFIGSVTGLEAQQQQAQQRDSTSRFYFGQDPSEKPRFQFEFHDPVFKASVSVFRYLPDENSESSINFDVGAEVEWEVQRRLFVGTGFRLFFINQTFPIGIESVQGRLPNGSLLAREHVSTELSVTGIELPLLVRYEFNERPGTFFLTAALSSRTSIKEKYTDNIDWKTGGSAMGSFIANTVRSTQIKVESTESFEFFNLFHAMTIGIGKSIHLYGEERGEIMLGYTLHLQDMRNIFQEPRFKKWETLGLTFKFPLHF